MSSTSAVASIEPPSSPVASTLERAFLIVPVAILIAGIIWIVAAWRAA